MNSNPNNEGKFKAALAVMALIAAVLGYLYFQAKQENTISQNTITTQTRDIISANTKLDSISTQLDSKIAEIQALGGQVGELQALKAQLEKDKKALKSLNDFSVKKYEDKIKQYEVVLAQKDTELKKLREENTQLTAQNQTLSGENTSLKGNVDNLQSSLRGTRDSVTTFVSQNRELSDKVTIASALKAEKVDIFAIASNGKERDGGAYRAKKVDKLRIVFRLADNAITKHENKDVLIRVIDPSGAVVSDMATGSGAFMYKGKEMIYTTKKRVFFDNENLGQELIYARGGTPYQSGAYIVELYSEGFKIGTGDFSIK